eukprot:c15674_g1_i1.p1 GENE.c15674_g1_i1~~c15674_g1_i1.p1  ORF type:complete len:295 (+),score=64.16 c15674_g1_i1:33-887(+)
MSLPLLVRKNIRDSEPKREEYLHVIKDILGQPYAFEVSFEEVHNKVDDYKDRVGDVVHEAYLGNFSDNLKNFCEDSANKEAFLNATPARKIVFRIDASIDDYHQIQFKDGACHIVVPPKYFWTNVDQVGRNLLQEVNQADNSDLPLVVRKNLRDNEEAKNQALARIEAALGQRYTFEMDVVAQYKVLAASDRADYKEQIGEIIFGNYGYLNGLANKLESLAQDDMVKEAINDAASSHQITFKFDKDCSSYNETKFINKVMTMTTTPGYFWTNVDQIGNTIESQL